MDLTSVPGGKIAACASVGTTTSAKRWGINMAKRKSFNRAQGKTELLMKLTFFTYDFFPQSCQGRGSDGHVMASARIHHAVPGA